MLAIFATSLAASHPIVALTLAVSVNLVAVLITTRAITSEALRTKCSWWPSHEWQKGKDVAWADDDFNQPMHDEPSLEEVVLRPVETAVELIEKVVTPITYICE